MSIRNRFGSLKAVAIFIIMGSALWLPGLPASAAGAAIVSVTVSTQPVSPGTQFTVEINVEPNNEIAGIQFDLSFSPSLVNINSISEGNLLKQNSADTYFMQGSINNNAGTLTSVASVITTPGHTISTSGTFAIITFAAGTTKGSCPITLSNVIVGDVSGQELRVNVVNGQVSIDEKSVIDGVVNEPVNGDTIIPVNDVDQPEFITDTISDSTTSENTQNGNLANKDSEVLEQNLTNTTFQPEVTATNTVPSINMSKPEIMLLSVILNNNNNVIQIGEPISATITYLINNPANISAIKPVLKTKLNNEPLDVITDLSLVEPNKEATIEQFVYIPSEGWKSGKYNFYLELVGPEGILCESKELSLNISPAATINWSVLLYIIAAAVGVGIIMIFVPSIRKRYLYKN